MKKIFQKNQIAITALAIMIAVAGYLNFTEQNTSSDGTKKTAGSVETIDTMDISDGDSLIIHQRMQKRRRQTQAVRPLGMLS